MIRCSECKKSILDDDMIWNDWLALMNYFEHEFEEGEITQATFEHMTDRLVTLKPALKE